jgi:hypothetical protein
VRFLFFLPLVAVLPRARIGFDGFCCWGLGPLLRLVLRKSDVCGVGTGLGCLQSRSGFFSLSLSRSEPRRDVVKRFF